MDKSIVGCLVTVMANDTISGSQTCCSSSAFGSQGNNSGSTSGCQLMDPGSEFDHCNEIATENCWIEPRARMEPKGTPDCRTIIVNGYLQALNELCFSANDFSMSKCIVVNEKDLIILENT